MEPLMNNGECEDHLIELLKDQSYIWNQTFNFANSMSLKCAVELGIPDVIHNHGRPMALHNLISSLPIHPTKTQHVSRLMSLLVHTGFFALKDEGYVLTRVSQLLLKDRPFSARPFVLSTLDYVLTKSWHYMASWFQNDDVTPFNTAFGEAWWEWAGREPRMNRLFNESMASDCSLASKIVISKCKEVFDGLESLVDCGGGIGTMAKNIAEAFPNMDCTVFDLPHVVAGLQGNKNLKFVGGNMFETIPSADAILLKWVLHDWNDEECIKILKQCKESIKGKGKGGKVMIIDMVMGNQNLDEESVKTQFYFDLEMMVHVTGKERNEEDWAKVFFAAGFSHYKIYPILGIRALIEVCP